MLSPPILGGKEDISRNWAFKVSLPTRLGNNCFFDNIFTYF